MNKKALAEQNRNIKLFTTKHLKQIKSKKKNKKKIHKLFVYKNLLVY